MEKKYQNAAEFLEAKGYPQRIFHIDYWGDEIETPLVDLLEEYAHQKTGWVSVDERLPEDDFEILVYTNKGATLFCEYDSSIDKFLCVGFGFVDNASHWQPLPEPPKV
jgi:hypothetical protein